MVSLTPRTSRSQPDKAIQDPPTNAAAIAMTGIAIIGGAPVSGMADACLTAIRVETSASGVAHHYGARIAGGLLDGWLVASNLTRTGFDG